MPNVSNEYTQKRVVLDLDRCIGCRSCEIACYYSHSNQWNLSHAPIQPIMEFPYHCRHCQDPNCVAACPREALERREDGIVVRHNFKCIGCMSCSLACPFGSIDENLVQRIISKCDLCIKRIDIGDAPACVQTCVSGALQFIPESKLTEQQRWGTRTIAKPGMRRI